MGPIFSVTSMRPSGRKAMRQGSSKVATVVIVNGRVASGFFPPTLTWPEAITDTMVKRTAVLGKFIDLCSSINSAFEAWDVAGADSCGGRSHFQERVPGRTRVNVCHCSPPPVLYTR